MFAFFSSEHPFARKESILRGGCTEKILTFYHHLGSLDVHIVTSSFDWQMAPNLQYLLCVFARDCLFFVFSVRIQNLARSLAAYISYAFSAVSYRCPGNNQPK